MARTKRSLRAIDQVRGTRGSYVWLHAGFLAGGQIFALSYQPSSMFSKDVPSRQIRRTGGKECETCHNGLILSSVNPGMGSVNYARNGPVYCIAQIQLTHKGSSGAVGQLDAVAGARNDVHLARGVAFSADLMINNLSRHVNINRWCASTLSGLSAGSILLSIQYDASAPVG